MTLEEAKEKFKEHGLVIDGSGSRVKIRKGKNTLLIFFHEKNIGYRENGSIRVNGFAHAMEIALTLALRE